MSAASYITSVLLSVVLFYVLAAKPLSSQSYVRLNLKEFSVYVSDRGNVHIKDKDTEHFIKAPNDKDILHEPTRISLQKLLGIGLAFSPEEFASSVPKEFKCFYMLDDRSGKYQLTLGGFLVSGDDYSLLSPEQAALEELRRDKAEEAERYNVLFIRCTSPVHVLKNS